MPSVRRHKPLHWVFLMSFHIALLLLIIGHLELFEGFNLFQFIPHEIFLGKGFVGLVLSLALLFFLFRRFASPVRDLSVPEDYYLLILLFLTVLFGAQMDWARRWYGYGELGPGDYHNLFDQPVVLAPPSPGCRLPDRAFLYAGPAHLLCQPFYHAFSLQQGHAFHF